MGRGQRGGRGEPGIQAGPRDSPFPRTVSSPERREVAEPLPPGKGTGWELGAGLLRRRKPSLPGGSLMLCPEHSGRWSSAKHRKPPMILFLRPSELAIGSEDAAWCLLLWN